MNLIAGLKGVTVNDVVDPGKFVPLYLLELNADTELLFPFEVLAIKPLVNPVLAMC